MEPETEGNPLESTPASCFGKQMKIRGEISCIDQIRDAFLIDLNNQGLPEDGRQKWKLVVTEALSNAVRHGCKEKEDPWLQVEWSLGDGYVEIEIEDPGPGIPTDLQNKTDLPENPMDEGGRGLFLIYSHCDQVSHWKSELGYRLIMRKEHPDMHPSSSLENLVSQTMEELSSSYESLSAFYRLGESLIQADRVTSFLESAVGDLQKLIPADHYSLYWEENLDDSLLHEVTRLDHSLTGQEESPVRRQVIEKKSDFVFEQPGEVEGDPIFSSYSCGCCLPIQAAGVVLATLQVGRCSPPLFMAKDLSTLKTYTDLFGIALAHANNTISRNREQQALREVQIAADLQDTLVPARAPAPDPEWSIFLERLSARSVSGDYVEGIRLGDGSLLLVIADVMGKGVSAAFLAGMLRTAVRLTSSVKMNQGLDGLLHGLNQILCQMIGDLTLFATAALVLVRSDYSEVEIVNAGHCPVFLGKENQVLHQIEPSGTPLGIFSDQSYQVERYSLQPGQWILLVTDGIFEWELEDGQIWGWDRFQEWVRDNIQQGGEALWDSLKNLREARTTESELEDDQTLLYWRREK